MNNDIALLILHGTKHFESEPCILLQSSAAVLVVIEFVFPFVHRRTYLIYVYLRTEGVDEIFSFQPENCNYYYYCKKLGLLYTQFNC